MDDVHVLQRHLQLVGGQLGEGRLVPLAMSTIPAEISFANDILPILRRLSNLQWVNQGFATLYGKGCPMDFDDDAFIAKLAKKPDPVDKTDPYGELRQVIYNSFRPPLPTVDEPVVWPHVWPWIYGDAFGSFPSDGPGNMLTMTALQAALLRRWVEGKFIADWPAPAPATSLDQVPLGEQPAMLDKSALHFCLADTFHPGCEMTWPVRHASMYAAPFRIRQRPAGQPEPDYGATLNQQIALQVDGPLYAQGPGDITRWMALPWQGDTAFCRSGYNPKYDPYVPTFWAARVPNQVLTEEDYKTAIDTTLARDKRIAAFNHRASWLRAIDNAGVAEVMMRMIAEFGALGIVEAAPGREERSRFSRGDVRGNARREPSQDDGDGGQPLSRGAAAPAHPHRARRLVERGTVPRIPPGSRPSRVAPMWDAIVAGAGPAGAVAAFTLSRNGLSRAACGQDRPVGAQDRRGAARRCGAPAALARSPGARHRRAA